MTEPSENTAKKPMNRATLIVVGALIGAGIYWFTGAERKAETIAPQATAQEAAATTASPLKALATGTLAGFVIHKEPKDVPAISFTDGEGKPLDLSQWRGRTVLLNLWATWCTPCKKEMPDLSRLQKELGGDAFEVVALSLDRKGAVASAAFLKDVAADNLKTYVEPEGKSLAALQAVGLPATILISKDGKERGRMLGPAKWDAPEAIALVKAVMAFN